MAYNRALRLGKATHAAFTRLLNQFYNLMEAAESDQKSIKGTYRLLEKKATALRENNSQVLELLLDYVDAELDKEMAVAKPSA
jgi:CRISPR/Cas system-associated exonuclease Cas4 (RecB family)